ncbi:MAG: RCC1 repeat-containing protein [Armatimonadota bacterium]
MKLKEKLVISFVLVLLFLTSNVWAAKVIAVTAGSGHTVALRSDGTVWAWGHNDRGQLGDGTEVDKSAPVQVSGLDGVVAIAAGWCHTVALKSDGTVWAWGDNTQAQLGDGTGNNVRLTPVQVSGLNGVVAIAAGENHTVALKSDGTIWAWGSNGCGQVCSGTTCYETPVQVTGFTGVIAIAAGANHTVAVKNDGTVWAWGNNGFGQLGNGTTSNNNSSLSTPVQVSDITGVIAVAAGGCQTFALKSDGTVMAWGFNGNGELGNGTRTNESTPVQVAGLTGVASIAAGSYHTVAVRNDGTVWGWGNNSYGQLGNGNSAIPVQVSNLTGVVAVAAGYGHTVILTNDGTIWECGYNKYGQLGNGFDAGGTPAQVPGITGVVSIGAGFCDTVALKNNKTVWTWGCNWYGQLGDGTTTNKLTPMQVPSLDAVAAIWAGFHHTIAVKNDGTVWTWGYNAYGQLGDGTTIDKSIPVQVSGISGVVAVSGGFYHTTALKSDGTVWAWGRNNCGQLGDGSTIDKSTPVQVSGLDGVIAIAAGGSYTVALKSDGTVWAWGYNGLGELGDGTTTNKLTPVQVSSLTGVIAISAGSYHTVALKNDGTVWTWGFNGQCQLGYLTYNMSMSTPMQVTKITGVTAIAAGRDHTIALKSDGTVWCWGDNFAGQLGPVYGSGGVSPNPLQVHNLTGVVAIAGGNGHTVAIKSDGTVWTWGSNSYGELGNGGATNNLIPQVVLGFEPLSTSKARASESRIMALECVVTGKFDDCIYVEDTDKLCGIKVTPAPSDAELGKLIDAYGTLTTVDGEKAISLSSYKMQTATGSVNPLGMTNQSLGGGDFMYNLLTGEGQEGVFGWQLVNNPDTGKFELKRQKLAGINNIGLLVRVWGKVIDIDPASIPSWFKISDGSLTNVKVSVPTGVSVPNEGDFVSVTGISSCEMSGAELTNLVRVRQQSDIE